jgi:hypothetical protein
VSRRQAQSGLAAETQTRENERRRTYIYLLDLDLGRIAVADNQSSEQKSSLVIRVPLSANSFASIYYSSSDGTQMSEREWWHLKQVVELASKMFAKQEERAQAASAGA